MCVRKGISILSVSFGGGFLKGCFRSYCNFNKINLIMLVIDFYQMWWLLKEPFLATYDRPVTKAGRGGYQRLF